MTDELYEKSMEGTAKATTSKKSTNLYAINDDISNLIDNFVVELIDEETGEVTYVENKETLEKLGELKLTKEEVVGNICYKIKELDAFADRIQVEIKRLTTLKRITENKIKGIKGYLQSNIPEGEKTVNEFYSIGWRKSQSVVQDEFSFDINEIEKLYPGIVKVEKSIRAKEAKELLKSGKKIPGLCLLTQNNIQVK
jgi:hypothetical protein